MARSCVRRAYGRLGGRCSRQVPSYADPHKSCSFIAGIRHFDYFHDRLVERFALFVDHAVQCIDTEHGGQLARAAAQAIVDALILGDRAEQRSSLILLARSEEHTSELQSLMRISYAVFC